ncbi:MAG: hypothetical protein KC443_04875, partial [Anaerolineales bacterium]|nr:hypothetical protein [Anaerolineales bacterium]
MGIQFAEPIEAIMAILFAVSMADDQVTADEFLTDHPLLAEMAQLYNDEQLADLQIGATRKFFDVFDTSNGLGAADVVTLTSAMNAILAPAQREVAFRIAAAAASANGLAAAERTL